MAQGDGLLTSAQIEKAMIVGVKIKEALARSHRAACPQGPMVRIHLSETAHPLRDSLKG
jgi:hypothetical protein